jgi:hypothetical protein
VWTSSTRLPVLVRRSHPVDVTASGVIRQRTEARGRVLSPSGCSLTGRLSWRPGNRGRRAMRASLPPKGERSSALRDHAKSGADLQRGGDARAPRGSTCPWVGGWLSGEPAPCGDRPWVGLCALRPAARPSGVCAVRDDWSRPTLRGKKVVVPSSSERLVHRHPAFFTEHVKLVVV